jgi:hypothetical protein
VKELLVDPDAGEVVMIDVDLSGTDRHALVPLRIVEIDRPRRVVRMDSADLTPAEQEAASESQETRTEGRERTWSDSGRVRYASRGDDEKVVERRPMVEEVVVRRRIVEDTKDAEATEAEATQGRRDDDRTVSS